MFEYLPWSASELNQCMNLYAVERFSILDLELGGECNYNCVYCDSPSRNKKCLISVAAIDRLLSTGSFRWVYICGLGEPTYFNNYNLLISILRICESNNVRCSIFTNLSHLTDELKTFIKKGILFLLFKYDTKSASLVKSLYGTSQPQEQLAAIEELWPLVHYENGLTNIAASIVPTQLNYNEITDIVTECINHHVYPLLGELELSGKGATNYENLFLGSEELSYIKNSVESILGYNYSIPMCPAVINGIHVNNQNEITVDSFSGLSCHWFWLKEPRTTVLARLDDTTSLDEITSAIFSYRRSRLNDVKAFVQNHTRVGGAFGGCGGDVLTLFEKYLANMGGE